MADEHAAEEVAHDAFMAVFKRPKAFGGKSKFSTWLCGIANNKAADWGRRDHRSVPVAEIEDEALAAIADPTADFVRLEDIQGEEAVRNCVDALPDAHREAVFWAYYQDEDMAAIAERRPGGYREVAAVQCPPQADGLPVALDGRTGPCLT